MHTGNWGEEPQSSSWWSSWRSQPQGGYLAAALAREKEKTAALSATVKKKEMAEATKEQASCIATALTESLKELTNRNEKGSSSSSKDKVKKSEPFRNCAHHAPPAELDVRVGPACLGWGDPNKQTS